jgi:hypothetical protein
MIACIRQLGEKPGDAIDFLDRTLLAGEA